MRDAAVGLVDGLIVGLTPCLRCSPVAKVRWRMSLRFVAITSRSMGRPIRLAIQPAKMSPKLPVGTVNDTLRSGAPKAVAALK